jgi:hypothetical protein
MNLIQNLSNEGASAGLIVLFVAISSLYLTYQQRKLIKLKQKFFQQNGGSILLQQLSTREDTSQSAQIFTEDELKKATKNYDESLIIGRGGFGTVFKGILPNTKIVRGCKKVQNNRRKSK